MNYNLHKKSIDKLLGKEPIQIIKYYAYGDGKVIGEYDTNHDAEKVSDLVDSAVVNKEEIIAWRAKRDSAYNDLAKSFLKELRLEYVDLPDNIYKMVYTMAVDDGHSAGYDEVASYVEKYANFARDITKDILASY